MSNANELKKLKQELLENHKLELLEAEYIATMKHADEIIQEYTATIIEKTFDDIIDNLSDDLKDLLLLRLLVESDIDSEIESEVETKIIYYLEK